MFRRCCLFLFFIIAVESQIQIRKTPIHVYKRGSGNIWSFFTALSTLISNQYNDTKSTFNQIVEVVKDNFSDTATTTPKNPFVQSDNSTSSTTEKYRISRFETGRIFGRNFRGLQKIFKEELNAALNESQYNIRDYEREIQNSVGTKSTKIIGKSKRKSKKKRKSSTANTKTNVY